jgi:TRAP-type uncharacterized transport system substrate-binding protein
MNIRRTIWKLFLPVVGIALLSLGVYRYTQVHRREAISLRCGIRSGCAASSQLAQRIIADIGQQGISLELVPANTSPEICAAINSGLIDLGVCLGGFPPGEFEDVRQVASLGVEPLHLLVREDLSDQRQSTIDVIRHKRVYLGEQGGNNAALVADLLRFAGLEAGNGANVGDFHAVYMPELQLLEAVRYLERLTGEDRRAQLAKLPDAVFVVAAMPAPLVDGLVKIAGYRLVSLPYATALHLDSRRDREIASNPLAPCRIERTAIPAYTYGASPAVPTRDCETIGLRLLLVANKTVPARIVQRLLRALADGPFREHYHGLDMTAASAEFPIHDGAAAYAESRRPLVISDAIQGLTNLASMMGAFCAGMFALWSYFRGLRSVSPQYYLEQIDRIERLVRGVESEDAAPTAPQELLVFLESRLAKIKQSVVEDFARGRLVGDEALLGILTMLADTRNLLVQTSQRICHGDVTTASGGYRAAA